MWWASASHIRTKVAMLCMVSVNHGQAFSFREVASGRQIEPYDALGRLRTTLCNVGGIGAQTQLQYDALDRIVQVTDPGGLNKLRECGCK